MSYEKQEEEIFRTIFTYGADALKTAILINGGASVALLTFVGNIIARGVNASAASAYSAPLGFYVSGVLVGAMATGGSYLTQYGYIHFSTRTAVIWHVITAMLVISSYVLFALGSFVCYQAIKHTI